MRLMIRYLHTNETYKLLLCWLHRNIPIYVKTHCTLPLSTGNECKLTERHTVVGRCRRDVYSRFVGDP